jgi:hypothetical protein
MVCKEIWSSFNSSIFSPQENYEEKLFKKYEEKKMFIFVEVLHKKIQTQVFDS